MHPASVKELTLIGRILVWAIRHWDASRRAGHALPPYVLRTFEQPPLRPALFSELEAALAVLTLFSRRHFRVAAPHCPQLSLDEGSMVLAIDATRFDLSDVSRWLVADLTTAQGLRILVTRLERLATELGETEHMLLPPERYDVLAATAMRRGPRGTPLAVPD